MHAPLDSFQVFNDSSNFRDKADSFSNTDKDVHGRQVADAAAQAHAATRVLLVPCHKKWAEVCEIGIQHDARSILSRFVGAWPGWTQSHRRNAKHAKQSQATTNVIWPFRTCVLMHAFGKSAEHGRTTVRQEIASAAEALQRIGRGCNRSNACTALRAPLRLPTKTGQHGKLRMGLDVTPTPCPTPCLSPGIPQ